MKDIPDFSKIINKELLDNLTFDEAKYIWRLKELIEKKFKQEKIKNDFIYFDMVTNIIFIRFANI